MTHFYYLCREINPYLAVVALMVLAFRVAPTVFVLGKRTAVARAIFAGYIAATALGAWEGQRVGNEAIYVSPIISVLHICVIVLFVSWDFGLSQGIARRDVEKENNA